MDGKYRGFPEYEQIVEKSVKEASIKGLVESTYLCFSVKHLA